MCCWETDTESPLESAVLIWCMPHFIPWQPTLHIGFWRISIRLSWHQIRFTWKDAAVCATAPDVLVLDEPTSGLDGQNMRKTAMLLKKLAKEGSSIVVITHDLELVEHCATRICYIKQGKIGYSYGIKSI